MRVTCNLLRMKLKVFTVDAFSSKPFGGNPAAVVPHDADIPGEIMQKIASEINLSETAFVKPSSNDSWDQSRRFGLRWFTPTNEVPLCGHATLATAYAIFNGLGNNSDILEFETLSGLLLARRKESGIVLDFPLNPPQPFTEDQHKNYKDLITSVVGNNKVKEVFLSRQTKKLLIRLEDSCTREDLEILNPNPQKLLEIKDGSDIKGVIVTLKGNLNDDLQTAVTSINNRGLEDYHFVSRYFAPWNGINEDPVTGSAHTVLGPYWSSIYGIKDLKCRQCSPRGGDLKLSVREDSRIDIYGEAIIVLQGQLDI